ncbi:hypothetical protein ACTJJ7_26775 [Phyllobacterium sp. 22229]|nr:hypothetical protein [Phyllobacterium myrsinacearum]PWV83504.1 hypothetical protein DEV92_12349 [Phyllobacterium myrsinacearum]RZS70593.1 hypothetical protein EV217_5295 [Phyllobacterium myrsinacearum]RZU96760.1 hypothetical protein EV654_5194 [Phyllobacterium myrsinacearum]
MMICVVHCGEAAHGRSGSFWGCGLPLIHWHIGLNNAVEDGAGFE